MKIQKNDGKYAYILPYTIKLSDELNRNYVTGFSLRKKGIKYIYNKTICIPLIKILSFQRIEKIDIKKQIFFKDDSDIQNYNDMKKYIEKRFSLDGILYLSDEMSDVSVRLSDIGIGMLYSRVQYRPQHYEFDEIDKNIIHFKATRLQTYMYFFKFGREAEILQPKEYRNFFLQKYEEAYLLYSQN